MARRKLSFPPRFTDCRDSLQNGMVFSYSQLRIRTGDALSIRRRRVGSFQEVGDWHATLKAVESEGREKRNSIRHFHSQAAASRQKGPQTFVAR